MIISYNNYLNNYIREIFLRFKVAILKYLLMIYKMI